MAGRLATAAAAVAAAAAPKIVASMATAAAAAAADATNTRPLYLPSSYPLRNNKWLKVTIANQTAALQHARSHTHTRAVFFAF